MNQVIHLGEVLVVDMDFIKSETKRLLTENIIEPSNSPWRNLSSERSQEKNDCRLFTNSYTQLDAHPLARINELVNKLASYKIFSTIDHHQITIDPGERLYTAFEADGSLYQFCRILLGVTDGVACFPRKIDDFIQSNKLSDTFGSLDNVTIGGYSQEHHDENLENFLTAANEHQLTFKITNYVFSATSLNLLGYHTSQGTLEPDVYSHS